jgi:hypothetical protein
MGTGLAVSGCEAGVGCAAQQAILPPQPQSIFVTDTCGVCAQLIICAQINAKLHMMDNTTFTIQVSLRLSNHTTHLLAFAHQLLASLASMSWMISCICPDRPTNDRFKLNLVGTQREI